MADRVSFDPFNWFFQRAISDFVMQAKRVSVQHKDLNFASKGNVFALSVADDIGTDEPWSHSLHFQHLARLLGATILLEDHNPVVAGHDGDDPRLVLFVPLSEYIHCYAVVLHVVAAEAGELRVVGSGKDWSASRVLAHEAGPSILVCEINAVPRDVAAISVELRTGARINRILLFRYG